MATFYILLFTIWQQKGKDQKINLVQSGNKKIWLKYKVVTLLDGNILQFGTLQFGNRKEGFTK